MRKIGYVRVSSKDQNEERQIKQLKGITKRRLYKCVEYHFSGYSLSGGDLVFLLFTFFISLAST
ncbi:recombinase family protein [Clostridium tarantellae]|uniref:Resolvase/invertase-type recombinase catalytic domain-containing protein n=1 Tax=Clostridium tarantellae TaxID=39493 RepID=A0A6I1MQT1_9CLOT|nr:recombinase family protein [Clostridium tarantellae]MPQ44527.1 hypothetical protein [Clostridium tarantellae]